MTMPITNDNAYHTYDNALSPAMTTSDQLPVPLTDPIEQLVADFLNGRETTLRTYQQGLRTFAQFLGVHHIDQAALVLSRGPGEANRLVLEYRNDLADRGMSTSTINLRLSAVRSLVRLARVVGLVTWSLEVQNLRCENCRDCRGPGVDGVRRLLDRAAQHRSPAHAARDVAMVRLMFDLGLRRGSVTSLDVEHLDLEAGRVLGAAEGQDGACQRSLPEPTKTGLPSLAAPPRRPPRCCVHQLRPSREGSATDRPEPAPDRPAAGGGSRAECPASRPTARAITEALEVMGGNVRAVAEVRWAR